MCGIAGVVGTPEGPLIEAMTVALGHRGPDGTGYKRRSNAHLGAARLSILDLAFGSQLIQNETEQISIAFNGEIYNHHDLRADLRRKGHIFTTETDTEVIIHLYEEVGEDCVHHLRGMFAFAILDRDRLFLARDRMGIKPLYYAYMADARLFVFASEIKAILRCPEFIPRLDMQAFADFLILTHPTGLDTFFEGLKLLAPGHTMTVSWDDGQIRIGEQLRYYATDFTRDQRISMDEAQEALAIALKDAVETHLAADVQVGLTLSGGLDSTVLALLAHELKYSPVTTFTVADEEHHPDMVQAGLVAKIIGSEHIPCVMSFSDYLEAIPGYIHAEERPNRLYGLPFYFLCNRIGDHVKACLHGEGADELFGGYTDYLDRQSKATYIRGRLPLLKKLGVLPSARLVTVLERLLSAGSFDEYLENIFEVNLSDPLERHHLDPVDKCAMAASVEMRVPYLDDRVIELVCHLPLQFLVRKDLGVRKYILRRLCLERFGHKVTDIVLRGKLGIPSAGTRLLHRFDQLCDEVLPDDYLSASEFGYCFQEKRQLLVFELFLEIFMQHRGDYSAVGSITDFLYRRAGRKKVSVSG